MVVVIVMVIIMILMVVVIVMVITRKMVPITWRASPLLVFLYLHYSSDNNDINGSGDNDSNK